MTRNSQTHWTVQERRVLWATGLNLPYTSKMQAFTEYLLCQPATYRSLDLHCVRKHSLEYINTE